MPKPLTACLSLSLTLLFALPALAQSFKPPKRGIPGRREGAGTRGTCLQGQKELMPLVPSDGFSTTTSSQPTFFWYVPPTVAKTAEFSLLDGNDNNLYSASVSLTGTGGVVGFALPAAIARVLLEPGKDLHWQFSVICDPSQPSKNLFVEGIIQRVQPQPALVQQVKQAPSARDRASIYASAGIWQEAISALAQQRCINPQDGSLVLGWNSLLQSVQLEAFANEPLAPFCAQFLSPRPQPPVPSPRR